MEEKRYTIGRKAPCDIIVSEPSVSSRHAVITLISSSVLLLEDLDSTNGTYVDNRQIKRKLILDKHKIRIGNANLDISRFFQSSKTPTGRNVAIVNSATNSNAIDEKVIEEFQKLEQVYDMYQEATRKLQHGTLGKRTAMRAALALIPFVGNALGILASSSIKTEEKRFALNEEFKLNYICPNCYRFLGNQPWKLLVRQKKCMYCKVTWVKDTD
ncbi:MAG: FHA domain-containing protein [Bernardetiaceae bacterium]|nr:FHA domain-containing protein [Bernardetiaceae bacterium]